jgi:hypothetical protein
VIASAVGCAAEGAAAVTTISSQAW